MSCIESKELTTIILNSKTLPQYMDEILTLKNGKRPDKETKSLVKQQISFLEDVITYQVLSQQAKVSDIMQQRLIKKATRIGRSSDVANILDNIDNILKAGLSGKIDGYITEGNLIDRITEKLSNDYVFSKGVPGNISNQDRVLLEIIGLSDTPVKEIIPTKLKDVSDTIKTINNPKDLLSFIILNRKQILGNKSLISVAKEQMLKIKSLGTKEHYIADIILSAGKKEKTFEGFLSKIEDGLKSFKKEDVVFGSKEEEILYNITGRKIKEGGYFVDLREGAKLSGGDKLQYDLWDDIYNENSVGILDGIETKSISDIKDGDTIYVQNKYQGDKLKRLTSKKIDVVYPKGKQNLGFRVYDGSLYLVGKYSEYIDEISETYNLNKFIPVTDVADEAFKSRWSTKDALSKFKQKFGRKVINVEEGRELYSKLGGNRIGDYVDLGKSWDEINSLSEDELILLYNSIVRDIYPKSFDNILKNTNIDDIDELKDRVFNYLYPSSVEEGAEAGIDAIARFSGVDSVSDNITLLAYKLLKGMQDEGLSIPQVSDAKKYIEFLLGKSKTGGKFIEQVGGSNIGNVDKLALVDTINNIFDKIKIDKQFTSKSSQAKSGNKVVFSRLPSDYLKKVDEYIIQGGSNGNVLDDAAKDFDFIKNLTNSYVNDIKSMVKNGKSELDIYKRKKSFQIALISFEEGMNLKYRPFIDEGDFITNRYEVYKYSNPETIGQLDEWKPVFDNYYKEIFDKLIQGVSGTYKKIDGKYVGGPRKVLKDAISSIKDVRLKQYIESIDISGIKNTDAITLANTINAIDFSLINAGNRILAAYEILVPGMGRRIKEHTLVDTLYGQLPKKISENNITGLINDQELKSIIFSNVSDALGKGSLDTKKLTTIIKSSGVPKEHIQSYLDQFIGYTEYFKLPSDILKEIPSKPIITESQASILDAMRIAGDDGNKSALEYFNRSSDDSFPAILKGDIKKTIEPTKERISDVGNFFDILAKQNKLSDDMFSGFSGGSSITARGVIRKYGLKKVEDAIDDLNAASQSAVGALDRVTDKNINDVKEYFTEFMGLSDEAFALQRFTNDPGQIKQIAYTLSHWFRKLQKHGDNLTNDGSINDELVQGFNRFLNLEGDDFIEGGSDTLRRLSSDISGSRILAFSNTFSKNQGISEDFIKFLNNTLSPKKLFNSKDLGDIGRLLNGIVRGSSTKRTFPGLLEKIRKWSQAKWIRYPIGLAQIAYGKFPILSQIPGYIIKKEALKRSLGVGNNELGRAMSLIKELKIAQSGIPSLGDVTGIDKLFKMINGNSDESLRVREAFGVDSIGPDLLSGQTKIQKIEELANSSFNSVNNLLDSFYVNDFRALHFLQSMKDNGIRNFSSVEDFTKFLQGPSSTQHKLDVIESINKKTTRTFLDDMGLSQADIDKLDFTEGIGNIPYLSKTAGVFSQALQIPFGFKTGRGNNIVKNFVRLFSDGGSIAKYLIENGFSDASKVNVERWIKDNPEFSNMIDQITYGALRAARAKRVYDQDDDTVNDEGGISDYIKAFELLTVPIQGLQTSSFWRAFGDSITKSGNLNEAAGYFLKGFERSFSQFRIISELAKFTDRVSAGEDPLEAFKEAMESIGQAGARYITADMSNRISNNYLNITPFTYQAGLIGAGTNRERNMLNDIYFNGVLNKIDEKGYLGYFIDAISNSPLAQVITQGGLSLGASDTELARIQKSNRIGSDKTLAGILANELPNIVDDDGKLKYNDKIVRDILSAKGERFISFSTKPSTAFYNGLKYYLNPDPETGGTKDFDLNSMFTTIEKQEGREYLAKWRDRFGEYLDKSEEKTVVRDFLNELSSKQYIIPGLGAQILQTNKKFEYDNKVKAEKDRIKAYNKLYGLKGDDKEGVGLEFNNSLKRTLSLEYIDGLRGVDRSAYQGIVSDILVYTSKDKLKNYVYETEKGAIELTPKWKKQVSKELSYLEDLNNGKVSTAGRDSAWQGLFADPSLPLEYKLQGVIRFMNYIDYNDNISKEDKDIAKGELLVWNKSLLENQNSIINIFGNDVFNSIASYWYGTQDNIKDMLNTMDEEISKGNDKTTKSKGGGGGGVKLSKVTSVFKQMKDFAFANSDIWDDKSRRDIKSIDNGVFSLGSVNSNPKPLNVRSSISSSISDIKLPKLISSDGGKDIERVEKIKKQKNLVPKQKKGAKT